MSDRPCWIATVPERVAEGRLRDAYTRVGRPDGSVHNLYKAYASRPAVMAQADGLYRAIMHGDENSLPPWLLELVSCQVAILAGCDYALAHHGANLKALLGDAARGEEMLVALREEAFGRVFDVREAAILRYSAKLTHAPQDMVESDIEALRTVGLDDGEILEVNQVSASFNYWVRTINGLGIRIGTEKVGLF